MKNLNSNLETIHKIPNIFISFLFLDNPFPSQFRFKFYFHNIRQLRSQFNKASSRYLSVGVSKRFCNESSSIFMHLKHVSMQISCFVISSFPLEKIWLKQRNMLNDNVDVQTKNDHDQTFSMNESSKVTNDGMCLKNSSCFKGAQLLQTMRQRKFQISDQLWGFVDLRRQSAVVRKIPKTGY